VQQAHNLDPGFSYSLLLLLLHHIAQEPNYQIFILERSGLKPSSLINLTLSYQKPNTTFLENVLKYEKIDNI
jgi:hypothetical protein